MNLAYCLIDFATQRMSLLKIWFSNELEIGVKQPCYVQVHCFVWFNISLMLRHNPSAGITIVAESLRIRKSAVSGKYVPRMDIKTRDE